MESGGRVQNLLSDPFSLLEIEDLGTDFLDFWEILLVQLKPSFTESCLRRSHRGGSFGLRLFPDFGGCDTILGAARGGVMATLQEFKGKSDLEASTGRFLLWSRLVSLV